MLSLVLGSGNAAIVSSYALGRHWEALGGDDKQTRCRPDPHGAFYGGESHVVTSREKPREKDAHRQC